MYATRGFCRRKPLRTISLVLALGISVYMHGGHTYERPQRKSEPQNIHSIYTVEPGDTFYVIYEEMAKGHSSYEEFKDLNEHLEEKGSYDHLDIGDRVYLPRKSQVGGGDCEEGQRDIFLGLSEYFS